MKIYIMMIFVVATLTGCESTNNNLMGSLNNVTNSINSTFESVENSINGAASSLLSSASNESSSSAEENKELLGQIQADVSTSQEVESLLGQPKSKSRSNGRIIWQYAFADIEFNSTGVVVAAKAI
jgi:PBP1b-binding outer membrane lipoprotein LpoB